MSLVNIFATADRVVILTDSSLYDETGRIVGFDLKCFAVESWTGAFTFRGNVWGLAAAGILAEQFGSFDEFMSRSGAEIEREHRAAVAGGRLIGQTMIEVHVAGWSERDNRARAYVLRSPGAPGDEAPPYTWTEIEDAWHDDLDLMALWRLARQGAEPDTDWTPETFDARLHGIPLAEEQRRKHAAAWTGFGGKHVIGGSLYAATVTREGVELECLKEWPDVAGEPIQPAPFDESLWPPAVPLGLLWTEGKFLEVVQTGAIDVNTLEIDHVKLDLIEGRHRPAGGLSRQQRRAAKAQARKGGLAHVS